eukprot:GHRR01028678.1.p1 GENE.GHRR01028678.1~~GHRR01028678.1.p1  ORF type:complete len:121 (+),score=37.17 GHRR01028678.1:206-568(+)
MQHLTFCQLAQARPEPAVPAVTHATSTFYRFSSRFLCSLHSADGLIPGTGHFHVLIDTSEQHEEGELIPFDDTHKHYGKGQTAADLDLAPGKHTLTLQFANALHESYGLKFRSSIAVNVQ